MNPRTNQYARGRLILVGFRALSLALLCALLPAAAIAQVATGTINGTVTDSTGAVIPQVKVTLHNVATGLDRATLTNETGFYVLPDIPPGKHVLQISKEGFNTATQSEFTLAVNQTLTFDFNLAIGSAKQTVTVEAVAAQIESSTSELGTAIQRTEVNNLPLNGRNFTQLLMLTPGVSPLNTAQGVGSGGFIGRQIGTFSFPAINGQCNRCNLFLMDGFSNQGSFGSSDSVTPILDSVQEFKVQSHNDIAAYGGSIGGIVNVVTKPGTSEYHGDVWEFLRNSSLDARNTFRFNKRDLAGNEIAGTAVTPFKQNQFGGVFGGPLVPRRFRGGQLRSFFFGGYEGFRSVRSNESLLRTPTSAELSGDLSSIKSQIFNPFTTRQDPVTGAFVRDPFMCDVAGNPLPTGTPGIPCNKIPQSLIDPNMVKYAQAVIPPPELTGVPGFNAINRTPDRITQDTYSLRLDHQLNESTSGFARFTGFTQPNRLVGSIPASSRLEFIHGYQTGGTLTHTFGGGSKVASFTFGRNIVQDNVIQKLTTVPETFWQQVGFAPNFAGKFKLGKSFNPGVNIPSFLSWGSTFQGTTVANIWQWKGDFTMIRGRHTFQMGADFNTNNTQSPIGNANVAFNSFQTADPSSRGSTGSALASFLLGVPDNAGRRDVFETEHGGWVDGFYFQDQWKASDRLTVNLGFRYDVTLWPIYGSAEDGNQFVGDLDLNNGTYIVARVPGKCDAANGVGAPCIPTPDGSLPANVVPTAFSNHAIYHNSYDNWSPRLGFAYRLRPTTVIRASAGRFFDNWAAILQLAQNYEGAWPDIGQLLAQNLNNPTPSNPKPTRTAEDPFLQGGGAVPLPDPTPFRQVQWFIDPLVQNPYSIQWNFGVQQQLGTNTVIEADYVGSHSSRLNLGGMKNVAVTPGPGGPDANGVDPRRPFPYITPTFYDRSIGRASYNAFQFKARQTTRRGMSYIVSYTWSKTMDIGCDGFFGAEGCSIQDPYNLDRERSVAGFDVTHMLVGSWTYELPVGRGKRFPTDSRMLNGLFGGWAFNGIWTVRSGQPYHVSASGDIANTGNVTERADIVCGTPFLANQTRQNFLNKACFQSPAPFTFGNLGRNSLRSNHAHNWDLSLFKTIQLPKAESNKLEFRAELFNAFNQTVLGIPNTGITNPQFGSVTGTANREREIQFSLKLYF